MSTRRTSFSRIVTVAVPGIAATALLGLVLAYWTWTWFGPRPVPRAEMVAGAAGRGGTAAMLFGRPPGGQVAQSPTGVAIKLLGVVAVSDEPSGYALLQLGAGKPQVVRANAEIAPGIRIEKVFPDRVILERGGARETLAWPVRSPPPAGSASGTRP